MKNYDVLKEFYDAKTWHRIVPYFQPIISIGEDRIVSAEALCRMEMYDGDLIMPDEFIPSLERTGEICDLDWIMIEKTCAFALRMDVEYGVEMNLSVNFSRRHIDEWDAVEHLCSIADSFHMDHERLEIEITEGYLPQNVFLNRMIDRIREKGFTVAVDDFGKGYSSLGLIKAADFDTLKLDKSLIDGDIDNDNTEAVISGILKTSDILDFRVIAEGVENETQMEILTRCGCDLFQGNNFCEPLCEEHFIEIYNSVEGIVDKKNKNREQLEAEFRRFMDSRN